MLQSAKEESTFKSLAQHLLLKTVGTVDVSGAAVDFINTGGRLHYYTRNFTMIGLSVLDTDHLEEGRIGSVQAVTWSSSYTRGPRFKTCLGVPQQPRPWDAVTNSISCKKLWFRPLLR